MAVDKLRKLIPPPAKAFDVGNKTKWAKVEKSLGTKLPDDYKSLIDAYGSGSVGGFYNIFNPFRTESGGNLLHAFKTYSKTLTEQHADDPESWPYPPFPELPGLIPWANDSNGNTYYWLVKPKKKPNDWTVVLNDCETFEEYAGSMTDYLVAVFKGKVDALASSTMITLLAAVPGTLTAKNRDKQTPLELAKQKKKVEFVEVLERAAGIEPRPVKAAKAPAAVAIPPSMQALVKLLPPPATLKDVGTDGKWRMAEKHFRTALPSDWRDFCTVYGSFGSISPIGLVIVNPFNKGEWPWIQGRLNWFRREWTKSNDGILHRYSVFPAAGGLFPIARMDPRIEIFYKTGGKPDAWPIVIWDEDSRSWSEHNLALTAFLTALFEGKAIEPWKKGWIKKRGGPLKLEG